MLGWMAYEEQRKCNYVQRLPYRPPGYQITAPRTPYHNTRSPTTTIPSSITRTTMSSPSSHPAQPPRTPGATSRTKVPTTPVQPPRTPGTLSATTMSTSRTKVPTASRAQPLARAPLTPKSIQRLQDSMSSTLTGSSMSSTLAGSSASYGDQEHLFAADAIAESELIGYIFATNEQMPFQGPGPDEEDPWNGEAVAFVVFRGCHPGIYATW